MKKTIKLYCEMQKNGFKVMSVSECRIKFMCDKDNIPCSECPLLKVR